MMSIDVNNNGYLWVELNDSYLVSRGHLRRLGRDAENPVKMFNIG